MLRKFAPLLMLAVVLGAPAVGCSQASTDPNFRAKVRAYIIAHPEVVDEAAAQAASAGIRRNQTALERDPADFVANPNGRITVVEFFDYKCPYCKTSAESVIKMIHDNPDVRFVFKEFPILSDTSSHAATYQLLTRSQGRYLENFQGFMRQPGLSDQNVADILKQNGVNLAAADTPAARAAVERHLAANRKLAHDIGVEGTPAFIVGGRRIDGWVPEDIQAGIDAQRRGGGGSGQP
jgi:protein-disulfide isomerase